MTKMNFGLSDTDIQKIKQAIEMFPEIEEVIIFGSRAIGSYKPASDIDLALKGSITLDILSKLKTMLDEGISIPYMFDLVDYHKTSKELKEHIDLQGLTFFKRQ
jgi:predicted nucleotidyltransferase